MTRGTKITVGILAGLVLAALAVRWTISGVYYCKAKEEIRLLEAEGGSVNIADLSPKAAAARLGRRIALYRVEDFKYSHPKGRTSGPVALTNPNVPKQDRITGAVLEMDEWLASIATAQVQGRPLMTQPGEWNHDWEPLLAKHIKANRAVLDRAKAAASDGTGAFDVQWDSFDEDLVAHVKALCQVSLLMRTEALLKAHTGDMAGALEDVRLMFRLRRLLDGDPWVASKLLGCKQLDRTAEGTLEIVLREGKPDRDALEKILAELSDHEERNRLSYALLGDTALEFQCIRAISRNPSSVNQALHAIGGGQAMPEEMPSMWKFAIGLGFKMVWFSQVDEYNFLRDAREMRARARLPFPEILASRGRAKGAGTWYAVTHIATDRLLPQVIAYSFTAEATADAQLGGTRLALAALLFRADTGMCPATPEVLVPMYLPEIPMDPHTGRPLRLLAQGEGFVVYAPASGVDHGGQPPDVVLWRFNAPEPAGRP